MKQIHFGSFEIQSPAMLSVLQLIELNRDKKYFIIVGEVGTGRSIMINYLNQIIFNNAQKNIFAEDDEIPHLLDSAIVTTTKESAYELMKKFDKTLTHVVEMPNLIERKQDIIPFSQFFIQVLGLMHNKKNLKLTDKAVEKLLQYNWPGHFLELESVLEQAFDNSIIADSKSTIEPEHIVLNLQPKELEFTIGQKLDEVERKYILQTLYFVHQNRTRAAEILGISIRTLRNKINQYREEGYL